MYAKFHMCIFLRKNDVSSAQHCWASRSQQLEDVLWEQFIDPRVSSLLFSVLRDITLISSELGDSGMHTRDAKWRCQALDGLSQF